MKALITGITGQDGSYLAEFLLAKGYEVHGIIRRSSGFNTARIDHIFQRLHLHYGDVLDGTSLRRVLTMVRPQEVYNLAAQSHVRVSFDMPEYTGDVTGMGAVRLLDAIRDLDPTIRYYQASSSEMYGNAPAPQSEATHFAPRSPYGAAKVYAYWLTKNYRDAYGIHASNGILFNHESPRRGETFVTRKITRAVGRIKHGLQQQLVLGNLDARRDWGHALDYVAAMWCMLQQPRGGDYVVATGETHTVREFLELAFDYAGLRWQDWVRLDAKYLRPTEVDLLQGDARQARRMLGWAPLVSFKELVREMVDADMKLAEVESATQSILAR